MGFLDKLLSVFSQGKDDRAYWIYVQCGRCSERLKTRVDLYNDLSPRYSEAGSDKTFYCRKVIIGSDRCFQLIEVQLYFDSKRNLLQREIDGGEFIS